MLTKLAWRNLWRQKRRTLLTASALALALVLSLFVRSLQEGTYASYIDNAARFYSGLIQLQHPEFGDSQSIDDLMPGDEAFIAVAQNHPNISNVLPRIESFALAAAGDKSKGAMVLGVEPQLENQYSGIADKVIDGRYLDGGENQVLLGESLARFFEIEVGDEIVLYGQGYRGQTAAGLYKVQGILRFPMPQLDSMLIYMPLAQAQALYSTENQVTNWLLHTKDLTQLAQTHSELQSAYPNTNVRDWQDLSPEMAQQISLDKVTGVFMIYLLYGVVGFGLFATLLMMTLERQREFSVMLATGMLRTRLLKLIGIESLFIAGLGVLIGLAVASPILAYFYFNPITMTGENAEMMLEMGFKPVLPMQLSADLFINQVIIVLVLLALCLIYPMWRAYRLNLVSGLKGGSDAN
ncbi:ABC transporter permease [Paraferrimonas sedimenticola]|uniref:Transporter n=1 Tax=Paraferrimonas sedimenticola TaxID=375674 RepID=A0AA37W158_9GAMM|nr:ABC transporter permease [Paraferrimonas sedimenticola]GLP95967.1 transporter [Paraferrimonas sedimenticola]